MTTGLQLIACMIFWVIQAKLCANLAIKRGRDTFTWSIAGLMFGFFALLLLYFLPSAKTAIVKKNLEKSLLPQDPTLVEKFWYYLDSEHTQQGPVSFEGLKIALSEEKINPQSYVWNEGLDDWKPLSEVTTL